MVVSQALTLLVLPFASFLFTLRVASPRALVLLVIPFVAALTGLLLSGLQGAKFAMVSDSLNYLEPEPWQFWIVRYTLWHMALFGIFAFKVQVLPPRLWSLAYVNLAVSLTCIWCMCSQNNRIATENRTCYLLHVFSAAFLGLLLAAETALVWARGFSGVAYSVSNLCYLCSFLASKYHMIADTGIPFVHEYIGIPLEWLMFGGHLALVYTNYPRLRRDGFYDQLKASPAGDFRLDWPRGSLGPRLASATLDPRCSMGAARLSMRD